MTVARANAHVTYPARFQLVAAMNPCRCGHLGDPGQGCARAPRCGLDYQARLSGPLLDRIDLHIEVPAVSAADLALPPARETSAAVAARVAAARARQAERSRRRLAGGVGSSTARSAPAALANAQIDGELLAAVAEPDAEGARLLAQGVERFKLSARGYTRLLRVARTLADLDGSEALRRPHIAEALSYRRAAGG